MNKFTEVTEKEVEAIARDIDPQAGGFFHSALKRAALRGAQLQRQKLAHHAPPAMGQISGGAEVNGGFAELRERFHNEVPQK